MTGLDEGQARGARGRARRSCGWPGCQISRRSTSRRVLSMEGLAGKSWLERALRMKPSPMLDVTGGEPQESGTVVEHSEPEIAFQTERAAEFLGLVAVVDAEPPPARLFPADSAGARVLRQHLVVVLQRYPISLLEGSLALVLGVGSNHLRLVFRIGGMAFPPLRIDPVLVTGLVALVGRSPSGAIESIACSSSQKWHRTNQPHFEATNRGDVHTKSIMGQWFKTEAVPDKPMATMISKKAPTGFGDGGPRSLNR